MVIWKKHLAQEKRVNIRSVRVWWNAKKIFARKNFCLNCCFEFYAMLNFLEMID